EVMKKIDSIVAVVVTSITLNAQTPLNVNGSLEDWTDGSIRPSGWYINESLLTSGAVSKVTGGAQDGNNFIKIVAPSSSYNAPGLSDISITAGQTYTISYYYKELNDGNARLRHWGQWRDNSGAISPDGTDSFQPN